MGSDSGLGRLAARARDLLAGPDGGRDGRDPDEGGGDDNAWARAERRATIAPVMGDPSVDPAHEPWEVTYMAGWGGPGGGEYGTLQGVDDYVVGDADATRELRAPSATAGGPLRIADGETIYEDRANTGIMSTRLRPEEDPSRTDWCSHL
jgi:hypothetical protein